MQTPELYVKGKSSQRHDSMETLLKYLHLVQWHETGEETVLDVGCGSGDLTWEILKPRLPDRVRLLGADIAPNMLKFAASKYPDLNTFLLDISTPNLPQHLNQTFSHIFSFYCLHWAVNQRQTFQNIFDMLKPGGNLFTLYLERHPFYDAFVSVSRTQKWKNCSLNVTNVFHLHQFEEDINENRTKNMLIDIGFNISIYKIKNRLLMFTNLQKLKDDIIAIYSHFSKIPKSLRNEFIDDIIEELFKMKIMKEMNQKKKQ